MKTYYELLKTLKTDWEELAPVLLRLLFRHIGSYPQAPLADWVQLLGKMADHQAAIRTDLPWMIQLTGSNWLLKNAETVGEHLRGALRRELAGVDGVVEVRGEGLMIGVELAKPCGVLLTRAAEAGLLISVTADTVIRLVPPLIFTVADADEVVARLVPLVKAFLAEAA